MLRYRTLLMHLQSHDLDAMLWPRIECTCTWYEWQWTNWTNEWVPVPIWVTFDSQWINRTDDSVKVQWVRQSTKSPIFLFSPGESTNAVIHSISDSMTSAESAWFYSWAFTKVDANTTESVNQWFNEPMNGMSHIFWLNDPVMTDCFKSPANTNEINMNQSSAKHS